MSLIFLRVDSFNKNCCFNLPQGKLQPDFYSWGSSPGPTPAQSSPPTRTCRKKDKKLKVTAQKLPTVCRIKPQRCGKKISPIDIQLVLEERKIHIFTFSFKVKNCKIADRC
jgi:hypothetical protein